MIYSRFTCNKTTIKQIVHVHSQSCREGSKTRSMIRYMRKQTTFCRIQILTRKWIFRKRNPLEEQNSLIFLRTVINPLTWQIIVFFLSLQWFENFVFKWVKYLLISPYHFDIEVTGSNPVEALIFSGFFLPTAQIGKFTAMITLHFHLKQRYKYEFHIYFTSFDMLPCPLGPRSTCFLPCKVSKEVCDRPEDHPRYTGSFGLS